MFKTTLTRPRLDPGGLVALEGRWRAFAAQAEASFFQDWTWVGCLAAERFPDPVLLEAVEDDRLIGLALFNRSSSAWRGVSLYLQESDDPKLNSIFVEHNGPLLDLPQGRDRHAVLSQVLHEAMHGPVEGKAGRPRRLILSGVGPDCAAAAACINGWIAQDVSRLAPYVDLAALRPDQPFMDGLSRNTRHQLRRSNRLYEGGGPLRLDRADTVETALDYLSKLIMLHEITWKARGQAGAFATPEVRRFHQALIARGVPRGEVDLLRVTAGPELVGYLINFNHRGRISAYQSGFNYGAATPQHKPGLTCHYLAIEWYRAAGAVTYDFLAGADRYKLSLANAQRWMHWLSVVPRWHPHGIAARIRSALAG